MQNEILYRVAKLNDVNATWWMSWTDLLNVACRCFRTRLEGEGHQTGGGYRQPLPGNQQVILDQMRERDEEVLGQIRMRCTTSLSSAARTKKCVGAA